MLGVSKRTRTQLLDLLHRRHHGAEHLGVALASALELTDNAIGFVCYDILDWFIDTLCHGNSFRWLVNVYCGKKGRTMKISPMMLSIANTIASLVI